MSHNQHFVMESVGYNLRTLMFSPVTIYAVSVETRFSIRVFVVVSPAAILA